MNLDSSESKKRQNPKSNEIISNEHADEISERTNHLRTKSVYFKHKEEEETEGEFALKKDIIDLIEIKLHQNYENKYIIDLSKYNNKVKKSNPEFITYGLLDIDPKINIKSYQNFNYQKLYNRYLSEVNFFKRDWSIFQFFIIFFNKI
jgi:hypothetical protein